MNKKIINIILLILIGLFLITASVLTTYTVMTFIKFKNEYVTQDNIVDDPIKPSEELPMESIEIDNNQIEQELLTKDELDEFNTFFNTEPTGAFVSSIDYDDIKDISLANPNLQQFVYPKFTNVFIEDGICLISPDDFIVEFNNLTGSSITIEEVGDNTIYDVNSNMVKFTPNTNWMSTTIEITNSYKIDNLFYFEITIDNNLLGSMKKEVIIKRDTTYKIDSIKTIN